MFCQKCGNPLGANDRFCVKCGTPVPAPWQPGNAQPGSQGGGTPGSSGNVQAGGQGGVPYASSGSVDAKPSGSPAGASAYPSGNASGNASGNPAGNQGGGAYGSFGNAHPGGQGAVPGNPYQQAGGGAVYGQPQAGSQYAGSSAAPGAPCGGQGSAAMGQAPAQGQSFSQSQGAYQGRMPGQGSGFSQGQGAYQGQGIYQGTYQGQASGQGSSQNAYQYQSQYQNPGYGNAPGAGGGAKGWRAYVTPENMEKLAALSLFLPLFMAVLSFVLGVISQIFAGIPIAGPFFEMLPYLVKALFLLISILALASCIYILLQRPYKRALPSYITLAGIVLAILSCLGIFLSWPAPLSFVFGLLALAWGSDVFSRVILQQRGMESLPQPGADFAAYQSWYRARQSTKAAMGGQRQQGVPDPNASYFDGKGLELFGMLIVTILLSAVTCGLALPWLLCWIYRWRKSHTVIQGRRLDFTGTGGSLFGHWILWSLLCVITCGIYSFFMYVALKRWEMEHTVFADSPAAPGGFDGDSIEYFGYGLLQGILLAISCGLAFPWTYTMIQSWESRHCLLAGNRLYYDGTAMGILGNFLLVLLLSIVTAGIYLPWGIVRLNKYICSHIHIGANYLPTGYAGNAGSYGAGNAGNLGYRG